MGNGEQNNVSNGSNVKKVFGMRVVETLIGAAVIGVITYLITIPQINTKFEMQLSQLCSMMGKLEKTTEALVKDVSILQMKDAIHDHDVDVIKENIKRIERERKKNNE